MLPVYPRTQIIGDYYTEDKAEENFALFCQRQKKLEEWLTINFYKKEKTRFI